MLLQVYNTATSITHSYNDVLLGDGEVVGSQKMDGKGIELADITVIVSAPFLGYDTPIDMYLDPNCPAEFRAILYDDNGGILANGIVKQIGGIDYDDKDQDWGITILNNAREWLFEELDKIQMGDPIFMAYLFGITATNFKKVQDVASLAYFIREKDEFQLTNTPVLRLEGLMWAVLDNLAYINSFTADNWFVRRYWVGSTMHKEAIDPVIVCSANFNPGIAVSATNLPVPSWTCKEFLESLQQMLGWHYICEYTNDITVREIDITAKSDLWNPPVSAMDVDAIEEGDGFTLEFDEPLLEDFGVQFQNGINEDSILQFVRVSTVKFTEFAPPSAAVYAAQTYDVAEKEKQKDDSGSTGRSKGARGKNKSLQNLPYSLPDAVLTIGSGIVSFVPIGAPVGYTENLAYHYPAFDYRDRDAVYLFCLYNDGATKFLRWYHENTVANSGYPKRTYPIGALDVFANYGISRMERMLLDSAFDLAAELKPLDYAQMLGQIWLVEDSEIRIDDTLGNKTDLTLVLPKSPVSPIPGSPSVVGFKDYGFRVRNELVFTNRWEDNTNQSFAELYWEFAKPARGQAEPASVEIEIDVGTTGTFLPHAEVFGSNNYWDMDLAYGTGEYRIRAKTDYGTVGAWIIIPYTF